MTDKPSATQGPGAAPDRFLASIIESTDDAIIGKTLDGVITTWNAGAQRIYGYSAEEAIGQPITLISPEERLEEMADIQERIRRGERLEHYETTRRAKSGEILDMSVTISPILTEDGTIIGASSIGRNITERKRLEAAERKTAELEGANAAVQEFIAITSHDLRTPIAVIKGFVAAIGDRWDSTTEDQKRQFVEIVGRNATHLSNLVDDLLMISRVQLAAVDVDLQTVDVVDTVNQIVEEATVDSRILGADSISVEAEPGTWATVDPKHLYRMINNYVSNAAKYGAPPITVVAQRSGALIEITVADRGPGVPQDFIPMMFDKFTRAPRAGDDAKRGSGLGLAIVRGLAEANGGDAWFEESPEGGAIFGIRLAAADPPA